MSNADTLIAAADQVDVIDCAGRIIANPRRNAPAASNAEVLALACATETFWSIVLDAAVLARAVREPFLSGDDALDQERDQRIGQTARSISEKFAAISGTSEEVHSDE